MLTRLGLVGVATGPTDLDEWLARVDAEADELDPLDELDDELDPPAHDRPGDEPPGP